MSTEEAKPKVKMQDEAQQILLEGIFAMLAIQNGLMAMLAGQMCEDSLEQIMAAHAATQNITNLIAQKVETTT